MPTFVLFTHTLIWMVENLRQSRHVCIKNCVLDADPRVIYTHIDLDGGEFTAKQACIYKKIVCQMPTLVLFTHTLIWMVENLRQSKHVCIKKLCVRCRPSCYLHTHRFG